MEEVKNRFTGETIGEFDISPNTDLYGADLRGANLREANLYGADLRGANLCEAYLYGADLRGANLCEAYLREANLYEVDLRGANLCEADLCEAGLYKADLRKADLRRANLRGANLREADLRGVYLREACLRGANLYKASWNSKTKFASPSALLLAWWEKVSDALCLELMRYDCANCPDGAAAFEAWANDNDAECPTECPYDNSQWQRCANFKEDRGLWSPGPAKTALELAVALLHEKCEFVE